MFVIEDNDLSTNTPTRETWGVYDFREDESNVIRYKYVRDCPHINTVEWVEFK